MQLIGAFAYRPNQILAPVNSENKRVFTKLEAGAINLLSEVLNEGTGVSIDDAVTETQCSFVAREVQPWQAVTSPLVVSLLFRLRTPKLIRCRPSCHLKLQNPVFTQ